MSTDDNRWKLALKAGFQIVIACVARNVKAPNDIRRQGVLAQPKPLVLYSSTETHSSNLKAVDLLGLGRDALRLIPVDSNFRIDIVVLKQKIVEDKALGYQPFCIIGNAGAINMGSIDDLNALADICENEKLWFHIDGAFGALPYLSEKYRPLVKGLERADSLALDLHKWLYMPFEAGMTLVRYPKKHFDAFALIPDYLSHGTRGIAGTDHWFSDYGIQLSRGFKALKVWMSIKEQGIAKYIRLIEQNIRQAKYFGSLVEASDEVELLAPVVINVVCFRFTAPTLTNDQLNKLNEELLIRLHEDGKVAPSNTIISKQFYSLRIAITNHRSRLEDFDVLLKEVVRVGNELVIELA